LTLAANRTRERYHAPGYADDDPTLVDPAIPVERVHDVGRDVSIGARHRRAYRQPVVDRAYPLDPPGIFRCRDLFAEVAHQARQRNLAIVDGDVDVRRVQSRIPLERVPNVGGDFFVGANLV